MDTNDIINEIKEKADIVEVVSEYIKLEKAGSNYKGLCPFHNDSNPSFFVSPSKKIGSCFVCKKGGDVISLLSSLANISYSESIARLGKRYGVETNSYGKTRVVQNESSRTKILNINKTTANFFNYYLLNSKPGIEALKYLADRGIDLELIEKFKIGLAPSGKDTLYLTLKKQGFNDTDLLSSGVISNKNGYIHDVFNNRIMFPIIDSDREVLGFSGRIYGLQEGNKYENSSETIVFKKSSVIYNLNNALDGIRKNHRLVIMEGFMDVIQANKAGLSECCCLMGTSLTEDHLPLLAKFTNNIVLCLDGDKAGQDATIKSIKMLNKGKFNISIAALPEKLDPDEYIKKYGNMKFLDIFEKGLIDAYSFRYEYIKNGVDFNNIIERESFESNVFQLTSTMKSQSLVETFIRRLASDLNISYDTVNSEHLKFLNSRNIDYKNQMQKTKTHIDVNNGILTAYEILIKYMLTSKFEYYRINHEIEAITGSQSEYIQDDIPSSLIELIYRYYDIDTEDEYFYMYFDFIAQIEEYFHHDEFMNIDKFLSRLQAPLVSFYNDRLSRIKLADQTKKDIEKNDCFRVLRCFIIDCGIKRFTKLRNESVDTFDAGHYADQIRILKRKKSEMRKV